MFKFFLQTDNSPVQFFIRIALGLVMFPHGAQKVLSWFGGPGPMKTLQTFSAIGFPVWWTVTLMIFELIGSVLLVAGFLTRLWAIGIGTALAICMFTSHAQYGFFMNWLGRQKGEGFEFHILILGITIALIVRGGGALSVDRTLSGKGRKRVFAR